MVNPFLQKTVIFLLVLFINSSMSAANLPDFTVLAEQNSPAVVNISTQTSLSSQKKQINPHDFNIPELGEDHPFNDLLQRFLGKQLDELEIPDWLDYDTQSLGSGFIISSDGFILTNHHVVSGGDQIIVRLTDRREFNAQLIGSDRDSDIALIRIDATDLPTVKLGSSSDLKVGEWVLAIGSPFGFDHSVTAGIVSAKGRNLPSENYVPFIQTDVAINPGNSGGPLFNLQGEVVGVNSQIFSRSGGFMGLSFAIPIELAMNVADQLKNNGRVARGYLGVLIQDVTQELAESFGMSRPHGALVASIMSGSPAALAGLQAGDVIIAFNGKTIEHSSQLPPLVGSSLLDKPSDVEVLRNGKSQHFSVVVSQLPTAHTQRSPAKPALAEPDFDRVGLQVENVDVSQTQNTGVRVSEVAAGTARNAGIRSGDMIQGINNTVINNVEDYLNALEKAESGKSLAFLVLREEGTQFIPIRVP
jgi:serine protease Do